MCGDIAHIDSIAVILLNRSRMGCLWRGGYEVVLDKD